MLSVTTFISCPMRKRYNIQEEPAHFTSMRLSVRKSDECSVKEFFAPQLRYMYANRQTKTGIKQAFEIVRITV